MSTSSRNTRNIVRFTTMLLLVIVLVLSTFSSVSAAQPATKIGKIGNSIYYVGDNGLFSCLYKATQGTLMGANTDSTCSYYNEQTGAYSTVASKDATPVSDKVIGSNPASNAYGKAVDAVCSTGQATSTACTGGLISPTK